MADIEKRDEYEEELALLLLLLWQAMLVDWNNHAPLEPPIELKNRLVHALVGVSQNARGSIVRQFGLVVPEAWPENSADRHARRAADGILERMRQRFYDFERNPKTPAAPTTYTPTLPQPSTRRGPVRVVPGVAPTIPQGVPEPSPQPPVPPTSPDAPTRPAPAYTPNDADREAATTVTNTWSEAEVETVDHSSSRGGPTLTGIWMTEPGACPICEPLHATHRSTWSRQFRSGPPAHPNCRCYLRWVLST